MKYVHIFLLSSILALTGCVSQKECPEPELYELPKLKVTDPQPLEMKTVNFNVINKANANKEFSDMEKKGIDPVVWGLVDEDYKNLVTNIEKMQAYIMQQHDIIEAYRQYYEETFYGKDLSQP